MGEALNIDFMHPKPYFSPFLSRLFVLAVCAVVLVGCGGGEAGPQQSSTTTGMVAREAPVSTNVSQASGDTTETDALLAQGAALNAQELKAAADVAMAQKSVAVAKALSPVTVYRFYNQNTSAHFYTSSVAERDNVRATVSYMTYEGVAFQASGASGTGLSPVFRFLNQQTGVHFYTISASERDHILATLPQFKLEGVAYYASQVAASGFRPLYRFYRTDGGFHFYTVSGSEAGQVIATLPQYRYEGPAYYVIGTSDPVVPTLPTAPAVLAGNPNGTAPVPAAGGVVDTSQPDRVIGTGSPASCTGQAVVSAVAQGGKIRFNCGPNPVTITLSSTAKVFNDKPDVTLDGQGLVTLSGGGNVRILYQNTCDGAQVWTTSHCQDQETPRLTVQNMKFDRGNSTNQLSEGGGGGAILVRGGQFKIVNSVFTRNQCEPTGPDIGGGAVRVFDMFQDQPVYVVQSTFGGGVGLGNTCSNGGALSSIGVSYSIYNSLFTYNSAVGNGANPARAGTPGGGSGGAIYNDGNNFHLAIYGSAVSDNTAVEGGSAVFYVSNDLTGHMTLMDSVFQRNPKTRFGDVPPGFFVLAAPGQPVITRSTFSN